MANTKRITIEPQYHGEPILASYENEKNRAYALGGLHYIRGNALPYFGLTLASWRRERGKWEEDAFGCDHETILKRWPHLAPLAALHLSDINGAPMHAEANGWYQLAGALPDGAGERYHAGNSDRKPTNDECLQTFADHCRVSLDAARAMRSAVLLEGDVTPLVLHDPVYQPPDYAPRYKAMRARWGQFVEDMRPRWAREAAECIARLDILLYGDQWKATA